VGKALRLSKKKIGTVVKAIRVNTLTRHSNNLVEDTAVLNHVLADSRSKGPDLQMTEADDLSRVFVHLDALEEREAAVIRMRFGLEPHKPMTLREVGEQLGFTRERIRQLEGQAVQKLIRAARRLRTSPPWPVSASRGLTGSLPRSLVEPRSVLFGDQDGESTKPTPAV
jgi:RNA polymerase primary sigma factor